jgi:hypothetical protein
MRVARVASGAVVAAVLLWASIAVAASSGGGAYVESCARSTAQWPPAAPPKTFDALRLGPVAFNSLAPRRNGLRPPVVQRPDSHEPFYRVISWFNISTSAARGVTITLIGGLGRVAIVHDGLSRVVWDGLMTRRIPLTDAPRKVRFPLCHDTETNTPQITQYGVEFLLDKPGCFTFEVQPVGQHRRYRATVRVLVSHCSPAQATA